MISTCTTWTHIVSVDSEFTHKGVKRRYFLTNISTPLAFLQQGPDEWLWIPLAFWHHSANSMS